jgi:hypothetical protein
MNASWITLNPGLRMIVWSGEGSRGLERGHALAALGIRIHVELDLTHAEIELLGSGRWA